MTRQRVRVREYKVMFRPERFPGSKHECRQAVDAFWDDVRAVLGTLDIPTRGSFDVVKARRRIRFLAETKFEKDVKPPFVGVFSHSTTVKVHRDRRFKRVDQVVEHTT
jgi:hypothetical protein